MSNREMAIQLIEEMSDDKLVVIIDMLKNMLIEEVEPDEWDLKMIAEAERENDGTTITLEDLAEELGIEL